MVTPSLQLVALNARTGSVVEDFGATGVVDMMDDLRWSERPAAERAGHVANTSSSAILGNALVASVSLHTGSIPTRASPNEVWPMNMPGDVVAYEHPLGPEALALQHGSKGGAIRRRDVARGGRGPLERAHRDP